MSQELGKVAVVILNYKVKELTLKCLSSVKKSDYENLEVIIVDNNSGDFLEEEVVKDQDILFIQSDKNLGFTGGNNIGIKKAIERNAEYIFILNPDTTICPDTISILVKTMNETDAGIVCPKIYFADSNKIWYAGGVFDTNNVLGLHRGVDEEDNGQYNSTEETDYATGAAMFISTKLLKSVGFFDDKYFLYYEDSDLCYRAKQAGFKVVFTPKTSVFHKNAQSTGLGSPLQDYYITRNRMLFAKKFLSLRTQFALFREAIRNLRYSVKRKAFWDFLTYNLGKGTF